MLRIDDSAETPDTCPTVQHLSVPLSLILSPDIKHEKGLNVFCKAYIMPDGLEVELKDIH